MFFSIFFQFFNRGKTGLRREAAISRRDPWPEVWLVFPKKESKLPSVRYNDAVEDGEEANDNDLASDHGIMGPFSLSFFMFFFPKVQVLVSMLVATGARGTHHSPLLSPPRCQEALCFGWIDSTYRPLSSTLGMQRYTPRRKIAENYSQPNVERLRWLDGNKLIHPEVGGVKGWG